MSSNLPQQTSGRKAVKYRGVECLNCGQPLDLSDVYCSYCGQVNSEKKLALADFFKEFLSSIINYDSRLRFTVRDLLLRPGTITKNYVEGKRMRYANPFRFFLSASIIYFLLQGLVATISGQNSFINNNNNDDPIINEKDSLVIDLKDLNIPQNKDVKFLNDSVVVGKDTIAMQTEIPIFKKTKKDRIGYTLMSETEIGKYSRGERITKRWNLYRDFYNSTKIKNPNLALDSLHHEKTFYNRWLYGKNQSWDRIKENPQAFASFLLNKIPFFLFFFAPFYALFFWLIYSKKKYNYMEHLIFIFHIFGFVFLGMLICFLPDLLLGGDFIMGFFMVMIGPFYFYKALRNFYRQNRFVTIIKFLFLNMVFGMGAFIIALIFFLITAATY